MTNYYKSHKNTYFALRQLGREKKLSICYSRKFLEIKDRAFIYYPCNPGAYDSKLTRKKKCLQGLDSGKDGADDSDHGAGGGGAGTVGELGGGRASGRASSRGLQGGSPGGVAATGGTVTAGGSTVATSAGARGRARGRAGGGTGGRAGRTGRRTGGARRRTGRSSRGRRARGSTGGRARGGTRAGRRGRNSSRSGTSAGGVRSSSRGRVLGGGSGGCVARQVVQRSGAQLCANDTEAGARSGRVGILESVPPGVGLAEERASNLVPVGLRVGGVGNSLVLRGTADGPAGLSNPDLLAAASRLNLAKSIVEQGLAVVDGVGLSVLEVWVGVHAKPVDGLSNSVVGAVGPGGPGVDVADLNTAQNSARDGGADLADVRNNGVGVGTNTSLGLNAGGRVTVKILTTD